MSVLVVLGLVALFVWVVRGARGPARGEAEPVDQEALRQAEEELAEDSTPQSLGERAEVEDDDDWGPGTGR